MRAIELRSWRAVFGTIAALCVIASPIAAQLPSFSGAEGYGGTFTGTPPAGGWFSDASVYHVTTTADLFDDNDKPVQGTLRGAFYDYTNPSSPKQQATNRIVVFDVGGTFDISGDSLDLKTIKNIYIAGQTAPKPVTIYGNLTQITASGSTQNANVIMRYLTFRKGLGDGDDAITFKNGGSAAPSTNMIIDHVSASWSEDEVLSVANYNTNITVQYTMMTDSLTAGHQYGSLIRPETDSRVTYHHNLYANDKSRNPRVGSYDGKVLSLDFRNNVIYNYSDRASYAGGSGSTPREKADVNYVGNYIIAGPATVYDPDDDPHDRRQYAMIVDQSIDLRAYQAGNMIDPDQGNNPGGVPNGSDTGWGMFYVLPDKDGTLTKMDAPFAAPAVTTQSAADAYQHVMNYVGNFWWTRNAPNDPAHDLIANRIVNNVKNNTQPAGGVPAAAPIQTELDFVEDAVPLQRAANWDTDGDGMPNDWEVAHGLNPNLNTDFKLDFDNDGYVNLQEYLDEIGAFPAPAPITFNVGANNRYVVITNWKTGDGGITTGTNWQPSRFDEARINSGTVVVDAAGQHAGVLKVGAAAGQSATLNITGGWLDVASQLVVGADPAATAAVNLSGGVLKATTINKGAGNNFNFNFTGGKLHAGKVNFDLLNNGGTLAPGNSIGQTHVAGNLVLAAGTLEIELARVLNTNVADSLVVDGNVTLGGNLNIVTLPGFTPTLGDNWPIIAADSVLGQFASITSGYAVQKQGDILRLYFGPAPPMTLPGDFNHDNSVDSADYVVWRKNFGKPYTDDDYLDWRKNFGATLGGPAGTANLPVPEPATWVLLLLFIAVRDLSHILWRAT